MGWQIMTKAPPGSHAHPAICGSQPGSQYCAHMPMSRIHFTELSPLVRQVNAFPRSDYFYDAVPGTGTGRTRGP